MSSNDVPTSISPTTLALDLTQHSSDKEQDSNFHPLLEDDIIDVFSKVSTNFLAGFSYRSDTEDQRCSILIFHLFTDYIETETACQWQICNKKPLTCEILVDNDRYLSEKGLYTRKLNIFF
ncbi:unnamed protein product [Rotaria sp. Silwood2]|nr:unnamed protein product [Rotaria sp. Silwood2]CAF3172910.1 unnamed protein product [Rotaria sp. Silwood2]